MRYRKILSPRHAWPIMIVAVLSFWFVSSQSDHPWNNVYSGTTKWFPVSGKNLGKASFFQKLGTIFLLKGNSDSCIYYQKISYEMNKEFAVVTIGNRISIMKESTDDYYSKSDFNTLLQNKTEINDKTRSLWWLSHSKRRQYDKIDFLPGKSTPAGTFNLWKGFAVEPKGGLEDIPKFHELCSFRPLFFLG